MSKPTSGETKSPIDLMMEAYPGHWVETPVFAPDIRAVCRSVYPEGTATMVEEADAHFRLTLDIPEPAALAGEFDVSITAHVCIRLPAAFALSAVDAFRNGADLGDAWAAKILNGTWRQADIDA